MNTQSHALHDTSYLESLTAEEQLKLLRAVERVNEIIADSNDIDSLFHNVLQDMLHSLNCDRTWLLYPCDSTSPTWQVPVEVAREEWPGAGRLDNLSMTKDSAAVFDIISQNKHPVIFDREHHPDFANHDFTKQFSIQSQMVICLRTKVGKPWVMGLHHCEKGHYPTPYEAALFEAISHRLSDALSTMLIMQDLKESEARFRTLIDHAPEAIFVLNTCEQTIVQTNQQLSTLLGFTEAELTKAHLTDLLTDSQDIQSAIDRCLKGEVTCVEWRLVRHHHSPIICEVRLVQLPSSGHNLIRASLLDITNRKQSEIQMRKLSRALEQTGDAIIITDQQGTIEYVNPTFEEMSGYHSDEIIGQNNNILSSGKHTDAFYRDLWLTITHGNVFNAVFTNRRKDGSVYYEEKTISPLKDDSGKITHFISSGRDISERMEIQERMQYLAHHDALTELPNRLLLFDRLEQAIYRCTRSKGLFSILFLDLDRFKIINDTLGHDTGDLVLQKVASRLREELRATDTIARLGGDEFAILLEDVKSISDVTKVAQNIINTLSKPIHVHQHELYITTSIGISTFPADGEDANHLLKNADIAMYQAKHLGKDTYQIYDKNMNALTDKHFTLEKELRQALENDQFEVYYQPKIDLQTQQIIGSEALLRWIHPAMGIISPADFIPLLEETGMIIDVGEWVMHTVCQQVKHWLAMDLNPGKVAVNLSVRQFSSPDIESKLIDIIKQNELSTDMIEIEITESLLIKNQNSAQRVLASLSQNQISLALDDFGTGYSSLSYLKRFPIDVLKIDQSFIRDLLHNPDDTALVNSIIAMAKALNLMIVAEGIETKEQYDHLAQQGCEIGQGYLISRPIDKVQFTHFLREYNPGQFLTD